MIIHSIVSSDYIFGNSENKIPETQFVPIKYGFVEIEKGQERKLRRIISTDPKDYLSYCPKPR